MPPLPPKIYFSHGLILPVDQTRALRSNLKFYFLEPFPGLNFVPHKTTCSSLTVAALSVARPLLTLSAFEPCSLCAEPCKGGESLLHS